MVVVYIIINVFSLSGHFPVRSAKVGTGTLQDDAGDAPATGLGFDEDGTVELRSSTEDLYGADGNKGDSVAAAATERDKSATPQVVNSICRLLTQLQ